MNVMVLGANGATGFNVVLQLLKQGFGVKAVARNVDIFNSIQGGGQMEVIKAAILEMDEQLLKRHVADADAVISCLGHNITLKGIYGKPRRLVADALARIAGSIGALDKNKTMKIILMNTTACLNKLQDEKLRIKENAAMGIIRLLLPPHRDNEYALAYLIDTVGTHNERIEWIAVRPDSLINESEVTGYTVHPSTVRSPLFDPGKTSRINVADFMARLLGDVDLWEKWKFKTPVIYNTELKNEK
jgi:putative NADH-flavin reductase